MYGPGPCTQTIIRIAVAVASVSPFHTAPVEGTLIPPHQRNNRVGRGGSRFAQMPRGLTPATIAAVLQQHAGRGVSLDCCSLVFPSRKPGVLGGWDAVAAQCRPCGAVAARKIAAVAAAHPLHPARVRAVAGGRRTTELIGGILDSAAVAIDVVAVARLWRIGGVAAAPRADCLVSRSGQGPQRRRKDKRAT